MALVITIVPRRIVRRASAEFVACGPEQAAREGRAFQRRPREQPLERHQLIAFVAEMRLRIEPDRRRDQFACAFEVRRPVGFGAVA